MIPHLSPSGVEPGICIKGTSSKRTPKAKRFWKDKMKASKVYHWSRLQNTCGVFNISDKRGEDPYIDDMCIMWNYVYIEIILDYIDMVWHVAMHILIRVSLHESIYYMLIWGCMDLLSLCIYNYLYLHCHTNMTNMSCRVCMLSISISIYILYIYNYIYICT